MPRRKRKMRGRGLQQIVTGERNIQNLIRLKKPTQMQAPGTLAMPIPPPVPHAPIVGLGRQRGRGLPHFGRYGELIPPPIRNYMIN